MSQKKRTFQALLDAQLALDDDEDMCSATRLKVSDALKRAYQATCNAPEDEQAEDFIVGIQNHSFLGPLRVAFPNLPPIVKSLVQDLRTQRLADAEGLHVRLYDNRFEDGDVEQAVEFKMDSILDEVTNTILDLYGMERRDPPEDDDGSFDDLEGLLVPGSKIGVRQHAANVMEYNMVGNVIFRTPLTADRFHYCIDECSPLTGLGMSTEEVEEFLDLPLFARQAAFADHFVKTWHTIYDVVSSIASSDENVFEERDPDMPEYMKRQAPRFVFSTEHHNGTMAFDTILLWE